MLRTAQRVSALIPTTCSVLESMGPPSVSPLKSIYLCSAPYNRYTETEHFVRPVSADFSELSRLGSCDLLVCCLSAHQECIRMSIVGTSTPWRIITLAALGTEERLPPVFLISAICQILTLRGTLFLPPRAQRGFSLSSRREESFSYCAILVSV